MSEILEATTDPKLSSIHTGLEKVLRQRFAELAPEEMAHRNPHESFLLTRSRDINRFHDEMVAAAVEELRKEDYHCVVLPHVDMYLGEVISKRMERELPLTSELDIVALNGRPSIYEFKVKVCLPGNRPKDLTEQQRRARRYVALEEKTETFEMIVRRGRATIREPDMSDWSEIERYDGPVTLSFVDLDSQRRRVVIEPGMTTSELVDRVSQYNVA